MAADRAASWWFRATVMKSGIADDGDTRQLMLIDQDGDELFQDPRIVGT